MWPQLVYLVLVGMSLMYAIVKHGQPKTGNENFWATLISLFIMASLLYWGGFFDVFKKAGL